MDEQTKRYWVGPVPERDDFGYPIKTWFVDGVTKYSGKWAMMNPMSYVQHGIGRLGTGYGQRYVKQDDGKWLKVEG
jgi:hypothetical protein